MLNTDDLLEITSDNLDVARESIYKAFHQEEDNPEISARLSKIYVKLISIQVALKDVSDMLFIKQTQED